MTLSALLLVFLIAPPFVAASEQPEARPLLRAARRHAAEAAAKSKEKPTGLLLDISEEQYRAGDSIEARRTLSAALASVAGDGPCPHSGILARMARVQWETGGIAESSATMKSLLNAGLKADRKEKEDCLKPLADLQTAIGDLDGALATSLLIPSARKTDLYPRIAEALARSGRLDEAVGAFALSSPLPTEDEKRLFRALRAPGVSMAEKADALRKVDPRDVDRHFNQVARDAAIAGDFKTEGEAMTFVKSADFYDLGEIAIAHARHGDIRGALRLVDSKISRNPDGHSMMLILIAREQSRAGDAAGAAGTRARALSISSKGQKEAHSYRQMTSLALEGRVEEALVLSRQTPGLGSELRMDDLCRYGCPDSAIKFAEGIGLRRLNAAGAHMVMETYLLRGDFAAAERALDIECSFGGSSRDEWRYAIAAAQAGRGDVSGALGTVGRMSDDVFTVRPAAFEAVAQAQTQAQTWPTPPEWIGGLSRDEEKARAWLGAARGMRLHEDRRPER